MKLMCFFDDRETGNDGFPIAIHDDSVRRIHFAVITAMFS